MAKAIIYYDENREILMSRAGDYKKPSGRVSYIETEIPDGYLPVGVDEHGAVITEAIPLTAEQRRIQALEQQVNALIGAEDAEGTEV